MVLVEERVAGLIEKLVEELAGELAEELSGCSVEDTGRSYGLGHCTDSKHDPGSLEVGGFGFGFPVAWGYFGNKG